MITLDVITTIAISASISGAFNAISVYLVTKLVLKKADKHIFHEKDEKEDEKRADFNEK